MIRLSPPHPSGHRPRARFDRRLAGAPACLTLAVAAGLLMSRGVNAQLPGLPVLQNAFAYPAITVAANVGYATDALTLAGAASWVPASGRWIVSGGAGLVSPDEDIGNAIAAGARAAVPLRTFAEGSLGVAGFAGAGGAWFDEFDQLDVAAGLGIGWRRAFGVGRGVSLHTAPHARWVRNSVTGSSSSAWLFRFSAGVDLTLASSLGVTIGVESGQISEESAPLMARTLVGVGLSYVFR